MQSTSVLNGGGGVGYGNVVVVPLPTAIAKAVPSRVKPSAQVTELPVWVCPVQSFAGRGWFFLHQ